MSEYIMTGHHVFSGDRRIEPEMVLSKPVLAIIKAPTLAELNIEPVDSTDEWEDAEAEIAENSPEAVAARIADDRIKTQIQNIEMARIAAAQRAENVSDELAAKPVAEEEAPAATDPENPSEESPSEESGERTEAVLSDESSEPIETTLSDEGDEQAGETPAEESTAEISKDVPPVETQSES